MIDEKIINKVDELYKLKQRTALLIDDIQKLLQVAHVKGRDDGCEAVNTVMGSRKYTGFLKYEDIYNDFCKKFPDIEAEDYRPAIELYIPQLSKGIPNAIIVWIKDGSKVIYIAEDEG